MVGQQLTQHADDQQHQSRSSVIVRRVLRTIGSALAVACIGAAAHRTGAQYNLPYGLVLSLLLVAGSTYAARRRGGALHVGLHLLCSTLVTGVISQTATHTRALIILGFADTSYPYWTQRVGIWWMLGMVVAQIIILVLPSRWVVDDNSQTTNHKHNK